MKAPKINPNKPKQCPYLRLANPKGFAMAWRNCIKDEGHVDGHRDCFSGTEGWWAVNPTYFPQ